MTLNEYIDKNLPLTLRECKLDNAPFFALPRPYNVPCATGIFQEMYYWDTYFTNIGHILDGDVEQARNNVENLAAMADRFGFVLNGNREEFLNNSQPPFLSQAAREVYNVTRDKEWLGRIYPIIKKEYAFYTEKRGTDKGLSHYDAVTPMSDEQVERGAKLMVERMGYRPDVSEYDLARGLFSVGESGWDVNPRMTYRAYEIIPTELNALIYSIEDNMAHFASELENGEDTLWRLRRDNRATAMREWLRGDDGVFYDYDMGKKQRMNAISVACLYPLYFGMVDESEALSAVNTVLSKLETDFGIVTCEKMDDVRGNFQWGYPNGWPPMHIIAVGGLLRYGYVDEAKRVAKKFVSLIESSFALTGHLWEKYDVVAGNSDALAEYETPPMLGWTYGAYRCLNDVLRNK